MVYLVPEYLVDLVYLNLCGVGYSNILFGVLMVSACGEGDTHTSVYGLRIHRIAYPFVLLIFTALAVPGSSFGGHLSGIIAALLLCYIIPFLMPKYEWI
jgi:membrane associated rhomboid family serine protease